MTTTATATVSTSPTLIDPARYVDPNAHVLARDLLDGDVLMVGSTWYEALDVLHSMEPMRDLLTSDQFALVKEGDDDAHQNLGVTRGSAGDAKVIARESELSGRKHQWQDDYRHIGQRFASGEYVAVRVLLPELIVDGSAFAYGWVMLQKHQPVRVVRRFA